ncbi:dihydrofolate reductase family protein [Streptomyces sp. NPDC021093]|uniref:dihydrofolate reductase family protein n=1 Tax=Streptomyces sp. NPDC021093 TaxID=3365112 RepID=UPI0037B739D9
MRKLTYLIATSIDGFIGHPDTGDGAFFEQWLTGDFPATLFGEFGDTVPTAARKAVGMDAKPLTRFDTIIQGRKSYQVALDMDVTSPYGHLRQYVASRSLTASPDPDVEMISGDLVGKVRELKAEDSELDIYLCGGGDLAGALIDEIDELIVKTYPVLLGSGVPFASAGFALRRYELTSCRAFGNGATVTTYRTAR